jgi:predicted Fe-Mo cluster-binding NifX family protein
MKICVTSTGNNLESSLDQRFGRAAVFLIVDTDTMDIEVIDNQAATAAGGAGVTSAQTVVDKDIQTLITGNVGPNAMRVLHAADIDIFKGLNGSVKENIEAFKQGKLNKIDTPVPEHFGLVNRGGK